MFEVFAATPETMGPGEVGAHAKRAEAMGFDGLLVADAVHDGLLLSAMALHATTTLKVCTGVLVAFPRSPMTVAVAAWDLQRMSNGRFELGLGTQVKANIVKRYSAPWVAPVAQLREYVQSLKAIFRSFQTAEPLNFIGEHYQFTKLQPFFNPGPIAHPGIPVFCGAVGPDMTKMVGKIADGMITHPTNTSPRYLKEVCLPRLRTGFDAAHRDGDNFKLTLAPLMATGKDEAAVAAEWEKQRQLLCFLYSTPAYWPSLELFGWHDTGQRLLDMTREGRWQDMAHIMTDEILAEFVPRGDYGTIVPILKQRYQGLAQRIVFQMPEHAESDQYAAQAVASLRRN